MAKADAEQKAAESAGAGNADAAATVGHEAGEAAAKAVEPDSTAQPEPKGNPLVPPRRPGGAYILFFRDKYRKVGPCRPRSPVAL